MGEMASAKVVPLLATARGAAPVERTDEELMLLVRAGSRDAMATLAARYLGPLTSFCVKLTGDAGAGEDVVQEVFVRVWARRAEWRPSGTVAALLYTSARNLCINRARDIRRRGRWLVFGAASGDIERLTVKSEDIDPLLSRERRRDALRALGDLPEAMREALLLRFDAEMPYEAIAAVLGSNESTVRSRVHHALRRLRTMLSQGEQTR